MGDCGQVGQVVVSDSMNCKAGVFRERQDDLEVSVRSKGTYIGPSPRYRGCRKETSLPGEETGEARRGQPWFPWNERVK